METWLLEGHRLAASPVEDSESILDGEPCRFADLDGEPGYEIVLLAEHPAERPADIPSEESYLYIFKRAGRRFERMLLHDAGPGRFARCAFPDFDRDGTPEILVTLGSASAPEADRFEILARGGFFFRPLFRRERRLWLLADVSGDGAPDLVTTHPVRGEEFLVWNGRGFTETPWSSLDKPLLARDLDLWRKIDARRREREKAERGEEEGGG